MITFAWPWLFLVLPLPWLLRRLMRPAPRNGRALRLPFLHLMPEVAAAQERTVARLPLLLSWLAWLLLVTATARPQWLGDLIELPLSGRDLMLAVDVSGSMEQQDYVLNGQPINRLDMVKAVAGKFIERREGDRLGLVLFGSRAYLQTPLTHDRDTVRTMLNEAVIGLAGRDTAIGDAIAIAVKRLQSQPEDNRVLILLTDGANTTGNIDPIDAAKVAEKAGVKVYTIGIGGGPVGMQSPFGILMQQGSDLDPATLQRIADITGGRFFQATDSNQLARVYQELDQLEPSVRDSRSFRPMHELYIWPTGAALLLSGLIVWLQLPRRRTSPQQASGAQHGRA